MGSPRRGGRAWPWRAAPSRHSGNIGSVGPASPPAQAERGPGAAQQLHRDDLFGLPGPGRPHARAELLPLDGRALHGRQDPLREQLGTGPVGARCDDDELPVFHVRERVGDPYGQGDSLRKSLRRQLADVPGAAVLVSGRRQRETGDRTQMTRRIRRQLLRAPHEAPGVVAAQSRIVEGRLERGLAVLSGRDVGGQTQEDLLGIVRRSEHIPGPGPQDVERLLPADVLPRQDEDGGVERDRASFPDVRQQLQLGQVWKAGVDEYEIGGDARENLHRLISGVDLDDRVAAGLEHALQRPSAPLLGHQEHDRRRSDGSFGHGGGVGRSWPASGRSCTFHTHRARPPGRGPQGEKMKLWRGEADVPGGARPVADGRPASHWRPSPLPARYTSDPLALRRGPRGRGAPPLARTGVRASTPVAVVLVLLALAAVPMAAQETSFDASGLYLSRAELEALAEEYTGAAASTGYSPALRNEAIQNLDRIRERLKDGDFRPGDRLNVQVRGEELPDALVVEPGPAITIPLIGSVSLHGILRHELEGYLTRELGRFIQNPDVRARSMIRVLVQGAVGRPGFYVLPANLLLGEVVMAAGGPSRNADLDNIRVERGDRVVLSADAIRPAVVGGRSLDQLNIQAGDEIYVPPRSPSILAPMLIRYGLIIASSLLLGFRLF